MNKFILKIRSFIYLLPNIAQALFSRPETVAYPAVSYEPSPSYRGSVRVIAENCVGCGLCVRDCPAEALSLEKVSKGCFRLDHYRDRCASCGQCEMSCKFNAIYLDNSYKKASADRADFFEVLVDKTKKI
ncbi:MAG: 4Fe-4S binding protein [Anaerolineaceae bacterium]|nr:4Fe-4S binding protein [Anaerolineaceae bacterium]